MITLSKKHPSCLYMVMSISVCLSELPQLSTVYVGESCFTKDSPVSALALVGMVSSHLFY